MIIDASAFVVALGDERAAAALRGSDVAAPDLLIAETLNTLWKLARRGLEVPERPLIFRLLDSIQIEPSRPYAIRAAALAEALDHPVYDCLYLALAEAFNDVLLTADDAFAKKLARSVPRKRVRLILKS